MFQRLNNHRFWETPRFIQSSPSITRLLIEFSIRELDMAQDQLLLLGNGSAEEKVAVFLVSWRNRLARLSAFSETVPCRCGARILLTSSV
jgi:CRP/FNR family transcriptional regulator, anaerobic regulatory protein